MEANTLYKSDDPIILYFKQTSGKIFHFFPIRPDRNRSWMVRPFLTRKFFQEILGLEGSKISWGKKNVSYEEILGKFPRPEFPQEILARILLAEEILKPKISWRHEEILRGNFGIT